MNRLKKKLSTHVQRNDGETVRTLFSHTSDTDLALAQDIFKTCIFHTRGSFIIYAVSFKSRLVVDYQFQLDHSFTQNEDYFRSVLLDELHKLLSSNLATLRPHYLSLSLFLDYEHVKINRESMYLFFT